MNTIEKVHALAKLVEEEQRESIGKEFSKVLESRGDDRYKSAVHIGKKYARVDFDHSGKLMIDLADECIYGIKAYGVIHRGHPYGTLDTIHEWDWSEYYPRKRS